MRNNIETDYLIFISSDGRKAGYEIFKERISENLWPIYKSTPQLNNVKSGKNVIFYIVEDVYIIYNIIVLNHMNFKKNIR